MASLRARISAIHELFSAADQAGILLWLGNGWAVDAMLGKATRDHEDVVFNVIYHHWRLP